MDFLFGRGQWPTLSSLSRRNYKYLSSRFNLLIVHVGLNKYFIPGIGENSLNGVQKNFFI